MLEKWFHDLSSENKFSRKWENKILNVHRIFFKNLCSHGFQSFFLCSFSSKY